MINKVIFLTILMTLSIAPTYAKLVQILHTNDLHGHYDNIGIDKNRGGYARLKFLIDKYKEEANSKGMPTLTFDGGDFLEGDLSYMAKNGARSIGLMNALGYDAVVIGNHDWQMGGPGLNDLLGRKAPTFPFVGANFTQKKDFLPNVQKYIKPSVDLFVDDLKISVIGLTTNEVFYRWMFNKGKIRSPFKTAEKIVPTLRQGDRPADFVFALTHMGHEKDKKLAKRAPGIDLIIGGHSHRALYKPLNVTARIKNKKDKKRRKGQKISDMDLSEDALLDDDQAESNAYDEDDFLKSKKKIIPIVQTGSFGKYLGRLVVNLEKGQPLSIVSYELIPIVSEERDQQMDEMIDIAKEDLDEKYGYHWRQTVVGKTEVDLINDTKRPTMWGDFIADAMREGADTQISIHSPVFAGLSIPKGEITREQLFNAYPRVFAFEDKMGWYVYRVKVAGFFLKKVVNLVLKSGFPLNISGLSFDVVKTKKGNYKAKRLRIDGKKVKSFKFYTLALPEGIVKGGLGVTKLVKLILRARTKTDITVIESLEKKLRSIEKIDEKFLKAMYQGHHLWYEQFFVDDPSQKRIDRTFVPQTKIVH